MPHRLIMYDALVSLEKGNLLTKAGDMALGMHLEGVHEVSHVFEIMKKGGYLRQLIPEKNWHRDIQYYTISDDGLRCLREGHLWYRSLPLYLKLWGRLGLPLPN